MSMPVMQERKSVLVYSTKDVSEREDTKLDDFEVGNLLGKGAFGRVYRAVHKASGTTYALKSLNKRMLVAAKQVSGALTEKQVLTENRTHPCIVRLHWAFQDETSLHMILDYCPGGDLYDRIEADGAMSMGRAKLYAAEISLGLAHLHDVLDVIYRDLKPENILIDLKGHAKLTDFGLAVGAGGKKSAFCGSTEYIAPEMVALREVRGEVTRLADWWGIGVLIHELLTGSTPFCDMDPEAVLRNIQKREITLDESVDESARVIMMRLLDRDVSTRLGAGGSDEVLSHPFWQPLDFAKVKKGEYTPEWVPESSTGAPASEVGPPPKQLHKDSIEEGDEIDEIDEIEATSSRRDGSMGSIEDGSEEEDEFNSDDEWHMLASDTTVEVPPDLFRGFTFKRKQSFAVERMSSERNASVTRRARAESLRPNRRSSEASPNPNGTPTRMMGGLAAGASLGTGGRRSSGGSQKSS